jgi:hypothetical protein
VVHELFKCMDGASVAAYKEMIRVIRFILDTKSIFLKLERNLEDKSCGLVAYSESDWTEDVEKRISIQGSSFTCLES